MFLQWRSKLDQLKALAGAILGQDQTRVARDRATSVTRLIVHVSLLCLKRNTPKVLRPYDTKSKQYACSNEVGFVIPRHGAPTKGVQCTSTGDQRLKPREGATSP